MNCNNTITKYYKNTSIVGKGEQTNGVTYHGVDTSNLEEVDYFVLDKPVNAGIRTSSSVRKS